MPALYRGEREWQRANDVLLSSTATGNHRPAYRFRCSARITAERISFRSPVVTSTANGAMMNPATRSRPRWWAGGGRGAGKRAPLSTIAVSKSDGYTRRIKLRNGAGTTHVRIGRWDVSSPVHG